MTLFLPPLAQDDFRFPPVSEALSHPDGLLAIGGDLSPARLMSAYRSGIFPWFGEDDPLLWWSPSERAVIQPADFHASRSLRKAAKKSAYTITLNRAFETVIATCAAIRGPEQTWITDEMQVAYCQLHQQGDAHSVEVWDGAQLVGGLYGVSVGRVFCGESMFSKATNASKFALWQFSQYFAQQGGRYIDCQMMTPHLASLGAKPWTRDAFITALQAHRDQPIIQSSQPQQIADWRA
ncbi:leucyl/phenylalanyl-tRNA--protein transferase [Salinivibrio kushneri]|uniref:Leucyl/phenylalanyl-tRNA--protein transferase n=1 Tax=Salinivibrio kushneri TaxID=1908198 RepID=A0AB36K7Q1_9GAMM|nr:leucyl/phenylalanyl-tRNA--protein transferase [Salinivibrio kushneri]OOE43701.1 leucyl/phenylalanyl-tRNA--protein transferase [Salinivibrio kushneri]OOE44580.1 leucyl/phenylalanyl-tRNA--protein transferase [Salinivibrio kushneri]